MRLVTFISLNELHSQRLGALIGNTVVDLDVACTWAQGACGVSREELPQSMLELIYAGPGKWEYARCVVTEVSKIDDPLRLKGAGRKAVAYPRTDVVLTPPLRPISLRDFYAFEQHVRTAFNNRGRDVPEAWYKFPVFYFSNSNAIFGPDEPLRYPAYTLALDYELEIAAIIGKAGRDIGSEEATQYIFGYTIFNDWSARDIQREEMSVGLGPAKGKDFASSLGPCIITPDELEDRATGRPGVYDLTMVARINGEERSRGNLKDIHYSFGEMISRASEGITLLPGEVIGSGTVGTGCLLELTKGQGPWLQPGDRVELEIERIGILSNPVISK